MNLVLKIADLNLLISENKTCFLQLESLIGCLLSVGYDLERQCPEQLVILKDLIRDAFIEVYIRIFSFM